MLALVAEVSEPSTALVVGGVVVGLAALVALINGILNLLKNWKVLTTPPPPPAPPAPSMRLVTHSELAEQTTQLKADMNRIELDIKRDVGELKAYAHQSFHDLADKINAVQLKVEANSAMIYKTVKDLVAPIENKIDMQGQTLAILRAGMTRQINLNCPDGGCGPEFQLPSPGTSQHK